MKTRTLNALLVEILMAMLFFALAATVILQVFVSARTESDRAAEFSGVLFAAQNLADEAYLADDPGALTAQAGGCTLTVETAEEQTGAGILRRAKVVAVNASGETVLELPCTRYLPGGEVTP